jgi:hypothetical protein
MNIISVHTSSKLAVHILGAFINHKLRYLGGLSFHRQNIQNFTYSTVITKHQCCYCETSTARSQGKRSETSTRCDLFVEIQRCEEQGRYCGMVHFAISALRTLQVLLFRAPCRGRTGILDPFMEAIFGSQRRLCISAVPVRQSLPAQGICLGSMPREQRPRRQRHWSQCWSDPAPSSLAVWWLRCRSVRPHDHDAHRRTHLRIDGVWAASLVAMLERSSAVIARRLVAPLPQCSPTRPRRASPHASAY